MSSTAVVRFRRSAVYLILGLCLAIGGTAFAQTPDPAGARPEPIATYLMADEAAEVALARSAAPANIGGAAAVWVLSKEGYREAAAGTNGFVCLVGRGWSAPIRFVSGRLNPEFWSAEVKAPMCLNPEAVRVILPVLERRTKLMLSGASVGEVEDDAIRCFADGTYLPPNGVAMSYMLSKNQNLGLGVGHYMPHVMLYAPFAENPEWGGSTIVTGWPFVGENVGNAHSLVIIPLGRWSDGTVASNEFHH